MVDVWRDSPRCELLIVLGVSDPDAPKYRRQSMILCPTTTQGVTVKRSTSVLGYDDGPHGGHAEIIYDDVRVPVTNMLGDEGDGFRIAQERLGPGRIHHAMRAIGVAERSLKMMVDRVTSGRSTFGGNWLTTASYSTGSRSRGSESSRRGCSC